ncbi:hypothetical protein TVAG_107910 [Trichomonas vaginalis G3]|uniref:Uncharacterized protein n=1 Tax=Trichomonas vaginalis (strain ATCC PRA-98 / G3) TaxID=412133 RepID=A2F7W1_TRIV3|nr:hypothetical protein TVAGG3_1022860 [Trichomonas vaginalis G3]EAX99003.1 hypothetical protein TVAG_107910 [Trichomonas vaginalis G3]KAI5492268.1 hypothetical protein TVAGG3_1022860 [Trichomonas vaginalis G3]|eukprot:XP_001311933.1 hypothetical protein [Trichomonas vaginalis G3]
MPEFMHPFLNVIVGFAGGITTVSLCVASYLISLYGMIELLEENRIFFKKFSKAVGVFVAVLGLALPLRGHPFYAFLLASWWCTLLFEKIPVFSLYQSLANGIISAIYWIPKCMDEDATLFQSFGDFTVFVLIPISFCLVLFSKDSEQLTARGNIKLSGPQIPLGSWLKKLGSTLSNLL